ncbi:Phosphoglucosamine mutase [Clostridiaceae bacterium JG1575]|nr:Phosphoglucosamine mutase [Clostridiaceae bacterium JG1575]
MKKLFGTDGVRGIANRELTPELAFNLGRAGAYVLTEGKKKPTIVMGKDTRISGDMLEAAMISGMLCVGANVISVGVVPTPAIAHLTRKYQADAGVMISASHNPVAFNGIKFFDDQGYKLSDDTEKKIEAIIESSLDEMPRPIGDDLGRLVREEGAAEEYVEFATSTICGDLRGLKVALDCANGAASQVAVMALTKLGAEVYVINDTPDGININHQCGSTDMDELKKYVVEKGCDVGLAFDGDADRCLAVDERGNSVDGDQIMLICALDLKEQQKLREDTLVVTVMSNLGLKLAAQKHGLHLKETGVGDRYVLEEMRNHNYSLGGEQSGHVIFLDHNSTGDGLVTGLCLCSILSRKKKRVSELAQVMDVLPQVLYPVTVPAKLKNIHLQDERIKETIAKMEESLHGRGRVFIRPSGTEPVLRIMLEGDNREEITAMAKELVELVQSEVESRSAAK